MFPSLGPLFTTPGSALVHTSSAGQLLSPGIGLHPAAGVVGGDVETCAAAAPNKVKNTFNDFIVRTECFHKQLEKTAGVGSSVLYFTSELPSLMYNQIKVQEP
jgi:hypothetical protein